MKARPRRYDPVKTEWLASCIAALVAFDLIVRNIQAVRASPAMVQKKDTFRLVGDYQAVNSQVEQTSKVMTDLLRDLDCNVWVDDVLYFTEDEISLLCLQDEILVRLESVAVHSPCDADDSLPSVDVIRAAQRKAVADLDNLRSFPTTFGQVTLAEDDLFRVRVGNRDVLCLPSEDKALQVRLMVYAHMRSAGHRGVSPTLFRLKDYCV